MGLYGDRGSEGSLTRADVIQLIGHAMFMDPARRKGTGGLRHYIAVMEGTKLPL